MDMKREEIPASEIIELKELRIGNLLQYKGELVHVTMLSIDADDEYEDTIGFCKFGSSSNEVAKWNRALARDLKRIPLTPEWIGSMGFEINGVLFRRGGFLLVSKPEGFLPAISAQIINYRPVEFVHQLQNLYFALTGVELQIKDKEII